MQIAPTLAIRGPMLTFSGDPSKDPAAMIFIDDAIVACGGGYITHVGPAAAVAPLLPPEVVIHNYGPDALISAGFLDSHVHYPQTPMIGAFGKQLLDWLETHTFPTEQKFVDKDFARATAKVFLRESLRNGITTSCVYGTVYPQSVEALFEEAEALGLRLITGKVLMDRHAPAALLDTAESGYADSRRLIETWHGRGRLLYAITPRFAITSTPEQLRAAGQLWAEYPDCFMQTHISESLAEIDFVKKLYPDRANYLDVYDHYGLCGRRAVFGHGIHLDAAELLRMSVSGSALAHCPTSNFFLGSGALDLFKVRQANIRVGLGTDLGAGTSFSILATLNEAYKAAQWHQQALNAPLAFYLATRGTAEALSLAGQVGSLAPGMEADIVVLNLKSTPLIAYRMEHSKSLEERLFIQMTLGDDRAIQATYVAGVRVFENITCL